MGANGSPPSTQPDPLPPRIRYAKSEIQKALTALENLSGRDAEALLEGIRMLELEDQLEEARELAADWRRQYEALKALIAKGGAP